MGYQLVPRFSLLSLCFKNAQARLGQLQPCLPSIPAAVWKIRYDENSLEAIWDVNNDSIIWARLREYWPTFRAVANRVKPPTELPTWEKTPF
jgi:hypothetical protein